MTRIDRVAVIGGGYMGSGILQMLAKSGVTCVLTDVDAAAAVAAHDRLLAQAAEFERLAYFAPGAAERIREHSAVAADIGEAVRDVDLVIEAVFEREDVKKLVLAAAEAATRPDTILASNTSSIPISRLAAALHDPSRLFGIHWFNPAQFLPSVEVIPGPGGSPASGKRILDLLARVGRRPVLVADSPGFVANRLQFALFREAALMVEEGLITPERLDEVVSGSFGFRLPFFGPFAIADMAGLDVYAAAFGILEQAYGPRFSCPPSLRKLVDSGRIGFKSGGGYLDVSPAEQQRMAAERDRSYVAMASTLDQIKAAGSQAG